MQEVLTPKTTRLNNPYSYGAYNKWNEEEQWIRISEGCIWADLHQEYCGEPREIKWFGVPEIIRNNVKIMDMNLLCKKEALQTIRELGSKKVNGKVVYYECLCGLDYRFLTQEVASALKVSRFINIRLAWDGNYSDQFKIKSALDSLLKVGYKPNDIGFFMLSNWKISYEECLEKMDLCKVWNTQIFDCYYDGQLSPKIIPIFWTGQEVEEFRSKVRKHNQLVNFKIDPEVKA